MSRITSVTAHEVALPIPSAPYPTAGYGTKIHWHGRRSRTTPKRPRPLLEYVVVRIETDDGQVGFGEAQADIGFFGNTVEGVAAAIRDYLGPQLVGRDPFHRDELLHLIDFRDQSCAISGIDLALHDLAGRALGVPVSALLGGTARTRVMVALEIAAGPAEQMAQECLRLMAQGVRAFKAKIGGDPVRDAQALKVIRDAVGPEVSLRADANQGYTPKEAVTLCNMAERLGVGLELLEQPVPAWDLCGMADVRRRVETLIEADESCYSPQDAYEIARCGAADVLNVKLGKAGGLFNARKIIAIAEGAGLGCVLGTAFGLGLEDAAKLHLAASSVSVIGAVEFTELVLHANLLLPPDDTLLALPLEDGCLPVPVGTGLGVSIDESRLGGAIPEDRS
ncbi:MAG TPA: enolase C-terminal domain-like protein [Chloroflexota bacterium]|nr:enolase C-terminal domain-like protein [Chloroflexota bacterium]